MISKSPSETAKLAGQIAGKMSKGGLIYLKGDLGTGKTTFTKGLIAALGVSDFKVKSPTYSYIREYKKGKTKIYHMDLYRLEEVDQLLTEEIQEIIDNGKNIVIIEWAEKLEEYLNSPKKIEINFKYLDSESREITVKYE